MILALMKRPLHAIAIANDGDKVLFQVGWYVPRELCSRDFLRCSFRRHRCFMRSLWSLKSVNWRFNAERKKQLLLKRSAGFVPTVFLRWHANKRASRVMLVVSYQVVEISTSDETGYNFNVVFMSTRLFLEN